MNSIQQRFEGFMKTPTLWESNKVYKLTQFEIEQKSLSFDIAIDANQRLGKYVERFVSYQLSKDNSIKTIAENIQISKNKITLGELDCILLKGEKPIHLEIIYKFYLYDASLGKDPLQHWIGPNRKDSLVEKLDKLQQKQLPLLYSKECLEYLESIDLNVKDIEQQVYFKAQLFVPFSNQNIVLKNLNTNCICGFYITQKESIQLIDCKFHIPNKKDWLIIPHQNVNWLTFQQFKEKSIEFLERKFSPLCWLKRPNGELQKMFLVWWE